MATGAVNNVSRVDYPTFSEYVAVIPYFNITTPANRGQVSQTRFTIGSMVYQKWENNSWVAYTMDAIPYLHNGRTMVPLRFVGTALNATIKYDAVNNSVTLATPKTIAVVKVGSNMVVANGVPVLMDSEVVLKDGRMYLPVSQIGIVLGAQSKWDGENRTATFIVQ